MSGHLALIDRYNPVLINGRLVRLRLFLEFLQSAYSGCVILNDFFTKPNFDCTPKVTSTPSISNDITIIDIDIWSTFRMDDTIAKSMVSVKKLFQQLTILRRYLNTFVAFESAKFSSQEKLTEALSNFAKSRKTSTKLIIPQREVVSW